MGQHQDRTNFFQQLFLEAISYLQHLENRCQHRCAVLQCMFGRQAGTLLVHCLAAMPAWLVTYCWIISATHLWLLVWLSLLEDGLKLYRFGH